MTWRPIVWRPAQGFRRWLAKQGTIGDRKAPQVPEAVIGGKSGDGCRRGMRLLKRTVDKMHSPQGKKANWAHPQMLLAGDAQRSFGHTNRRANLCQIQRPAGVCIQEFLEPGDDHVVAAATAGHSRGAG